VRKWAKEYTATEKLVDIWNDLSEGTKTERSQQLCERVRGLLSLSFVPELKDVSGKIWNIIDVEQLFYHCGRLGVMGDPFKFDDIGDQIEYQLEVANPSSSPAPIIQGKPRKKQTVSGTPKPAR
jgi:hypothetical protein